LIYFKDKEAVEVDSYITKVKENALFVLIPQFGVEEKIILDSSEKGEYKYNKKTQSLECRHKERKRGKEREGEEEREEEEGGTDQEEETEEGEKVEEEKEEEQEKREGEKSEEQEKEEQLSEMRGEEEEEEEEEREEEEEEEEEEEGGEVGRLVEGRGAVALTVLGTGDVVVVLTGVLFVFVCCPSLTSD